MPGPGTWTPTGRASRAAGSAELGFDDRPLTLAAGKAYTRSFFDAAWGPSSSLPRMYHDSAKVRFDTSMMSTDPPSRAGSAEASERSRVTLYDSANHVVKAQWRTDWAGEYFDFGAKIRKKGWYRLQVDAVRYRPGVQHPADMLSPRVLAAFRMRLDPKAKSRFADVILPRMVPAGLDLNNRALPGARTVVQIVPDRRNTAPDLAFGKVTAKTVTAQASFDDGRTWRSVRVTKAGGTWQAIVDNPASGAVALRARITTTAGAYAQVTIFRAYALGS